MTDEIKAQYAKLAQLYAKRGPDKEDVEQEIAVVRCELRRLQTIEANRMQAEAAEDIAILDKALEILDRQIGE